MAGEGITGAFAKQSGCGDSNHDRPGKEAASLLFGVILLVHLREQRDNCGGSRHGRCAADDVDRQKGRLAAMTNIAAPNARMRDAAREVSRPARVTSATT